LIRGHGRGPRQDDDDDDDGILRLANGLEINHPSDFVGANLETDDYDDLTSKDALKLAGLHKPGTPRDVTQEGGARSW
jgi:hypothetical protein